MGPHNSVCTRARVLRNIQKESQAYNWKPDADFEINLKYAFCIVMGAVRFDVHDILSLSDLDEIHRDYFQNNGHRRRSVRPGPAAIIKLAEGGHWIQIPNQDIDDKSKADIIQKTLVVIQVLWMVTQCIARRIYDLPLSLLEVHTIVHVVCAILLYACWFEKPLNIQEAMVIPTQDFKNDLAVMLQPSFYSEVSCKMALFAPKTDDDAVPPTDVDGLPMQWVEPQAGLTMYEGNILPSGLALSKSKIKKPWPSEIYYIDPQGESTGASILLEHEFLARWEAILNTLSSVDRGMLARGSKKIIMQRIDKREEPHDSSSDRKVLFLPLLEELEPKLVSDWQKLFWDGESILHLEWVDITETEDIRTLKESVTRLDMDIFSLRFMVLAMVLSGLYGGVHLTIWGQAFPSYVEELMWKQFAWSRFALEAMVSIATE
ncbi:uncharacterized protein FIESC28_02974 [Fusarium coffeatum]|uniref:Uncharacterized protein n=1 Tax=Fusarium coffeatum TaxID=231269 RepID=A0A366S4I3_9HYPO|nr:uncharacterized protein FIESC28_02974 [Fusarium coffeatum]RBR24241.1 hypothetical protein FIESC28_02974 [Fusarium coffeatum]